MSCNKVPSTGCGDGGAGERSGEEDEGPAAGAGGASPNAGESWPEGRSRGRSRSKSVGSDKSESPSGTGEEAVVEVQGPRESEPEFLCVTEQREGVGTPAPPGAVSDEAGEAADQPGVGSGSDRRCNIRWSSRQHARGERQ